MMLLFITSDITVTALDVQTLQLYSHQLRQQTRTSLSYFPLFHTQSEKGKAESYAFLTNLQLDHFSDKRRTLSPSLSGLFIQLCTLCISVRGHDRKHSLNLFEHVQSSSRTGVGLIQQLQTARGALQHSHRIKPAQHFALHKQWW